MEKSKRLLTLVAIVAVVTISGVALAINGNLRFLSPNLDLVQDFSDIVESPRRMTYPFTLTDLPEYFNASVIIEGSGYTGQPHTVYVLINHTRPDSSVWLAAGNYSLTIENGVITENITSGSFSDLRNTESFVSPGHSWTPAIPADTYDIVLSLNDIFWSILPEYTIKASAGTGGTITPSGSNVVLEGDDLTFTIEPDTGYEILTVMVDGVSKGWAESYTFTDVHADYIITPLFGLIMHPIIATAGSGGSITPLGQVDVAQGNSQAFNITADIGYAILDVLVDGVSVGAVDSYEFINVQTLHTIEASFTPIMTIFEDSLFEDAVDRFSDLGVLLDGSDLPVMYELGDPVSMLWTVRFDAALYEIMGEVTYELLARQAGEADIVLATTTIGALSVPDGGTWGATDPFNAPPAGLYTLVLHITAYSNIP